MYGGHRINFDKMTKIFKGKIRLEDDYEIEEKRTEINIVQLTPALQKIYIKRMIRDVIKEMNFKNE